MSFISILTEQLRAVMDLGGPVVMILLGLSVVSVTVILWKLWQLLRFGAGRHARIYTALKLWDSGAQDKARGVLSQSENRLALIFVRATQGTVSAETQTRVEAEAVAQLDQLERGFRVLDSIAQISPLLGLFGTVLGMIDAFRAMQEAGANVDPSLLAGGIWVALLTTATGLAVAMPTSLALTFFESRIARERGVADLAIETLYTPMAHGA